MLENVKISINTQADESDIIRSNYPSRSVLASTQTSHELKPIESTASFSHKYDRVKSKVLEMTRRR